MDEPKWKRGWLEWAIIIALVVVAVIACLYVLGQLTPSNLFKNLPNNSL